MLPPVVLARHTGLRAKQPRNRLEIREDRQLDTAKTDQLRLSPDDDQTNICASDEIICQEIVHQIQANDPRGADRLYQYFAKDIRIVLCRQLKYEDAQERLHDVVMAAILAVRNGKVREPARLGAYIRTITRRFAILTLQARMERRQFDVNEDVLDNIGDCSVNTPERDCIYGQLAQIALQALNSLRPRYRELLRRVYLLEQDPPMIQRDMNLTLSQFNVTKFRAKRRYFHIVRSQLGSPLPQPQKKAVKTAFC